MKKIFSAILAFTLLFSTLSCLYGCAENKLDNKHTKTAFDTIVSDPSNIVARSESLTEGIKPSNIAVRDLTASDKSHYYGFTADLFANTHTDGKNTLVSPLSVYFALSMLTNGADGNTLNELEETLGMTKEELNLFVKSYMSTLPETDSCKMKIANSVWFRDAKWFSVEKNFLQANSDYYSADIYKAPFDKTTVEDINSWVNEKTDGMIPGVIDDISAETVMYLINALTFEAEWAEKYDKYSVLDGKFTAADGSVQDAEFMYSDEAYVLKDDNTIGFLKHYEGRDYAFVALLPDEDVKIDSYIKSLDGEKIDGLLSSKKSTKVTTSMPKFKIEFKEELIDPLTKMGICDAFKSGSADLSLLGQSSKGNLFVSSVIHKTFIEVNEAGTKAGAVTSITVETECAASDSVILNRPFVYMIIDVKNGLPLFIGNVSSIS